MVLALLTKKIDFPAHRLQKSKTFQDQIAIGSRIQDLKHRRAKKPFETVAVEFGCSVRKVQGCWAVYRDFSEELSREKHRDDALMDMAYEAARDSAIAHLKEEHGDREFTDEEVSDEIEAQQQAWADFDY